MFFETENILKTLKMRNQKINATSGVAWHTPIRTCVRLKIEIQNLEKAKMLKYAIIIFVKWGLEVNV